MGRRHVDLPAKETGQRWPRYGTEIKASALGDYFSRGTFSTAKGLTRRHLHRYRALGRQQLSGISCTTPCSVREAIPAVAELKSVTAKGGTDTPMLSPTPIPALSQAHGQAATQQAGLGGTRAELARGFLIRRGRALAGRTGLDHPAFGGDFVGYLHTNSQRREPLAPVH